MAYGFTLQRSAWERDFIPTVEYTEITKTPPAKAVQPDRESLFSLLLSSLTGPQKSAETAPTAKAQPVKLLEAPQSASFKNSGIIDASTDRIWEQGTGFVFDSAI